MHTALNSRAIGGHMPKDARCKFTSISAFILRTDTLLNCLRTVQQCNTYLSLCPSDLFAWSFFSGPRSIFDSYFVLDADRTRTRNRYLSCVVDDRRMALAVEASQQSIFLEISWLSQRSMGRLKPSAYSAMFLFFW